MTDPTPPSPAPDEQDRPDFGPGGYLPDRAAARARKIILRAPLGLHWIWAALAAGLVVVIAGSLFLASRGGPPGPPFEPLGPVAQFTTAAEVDGVLVVGAGGVVRAFDAPAGVTYCPTSGRLEGPDDEVWLLTGRGLAGTPSLVDHPVTVVDGLVYLDRTQSRPGPAPDDRDVTPACR